MEGFGGVGGSALDGDCAGGGAGHGVFAGGVGVGED